jgi:hypothetical protein
VLFAAAAWVNYVAAFRDARERVDRARDAIHEYTLKAFENDELILDRVAEHVAGTDPSELIGSEEFHRYLRQFEGKPQISGVGLIIPGQGPRHGSRDLSARSPAPSARRVQCRQNHEVSQIVEPLLDGPKVSRSTM